MSPLACGADVLRRVPELASVGGVHPHRAIVTPPTTTRRPAIGKMDLGGGHLTERISGQPADDANARENRRMRSNAVIRSAIAQGDVPSLVHRN